MQQQGQLKNNLKSLYAYEVSKLNIPTFGCHLSYWLVNEFPINSNAFCGAIEKGSAALKKQGIKGYLSQ
jgi:hypothetical protein